MSKFTDFLNLFKWDIETDGEEEFNIDKALNENWDKINNKVKQHVNSTDFIHQNVTQNKDGFMSKEDKQKIDEIEDKAQVNKIEKIKKNGNELPIADKEVDIELDKNDVGLGNVDNTSDEDKPISNLQQEEFNNLEQAINELDPSKIINEATEVNDEDLLLVVQNGVKKKVPASKVGTGGPGGTGNTVIYDKVPIGTIVEFGGENAPIDWLMCDGQEVSRTTYSELFAVIGTIYGEGDGSTTFNLPDYRGKVGIGLDSTDTDFDSIGNTGGEKEHLLVKDEIPGHSHSVNVTKSTGGDGTGSYGIQMRQSNSYSGADISEKTTANNYNGILVSGGGDQSHNNLQPYVVTNYIIKAKKSAVSATGDILPVRKYSYIQH